MCSEFEINKPHIKYKADCQTVKKNNSNALFTASSLVVLDIITKPALIALM